jgi:hypothetical protein
METQAGCDEPYQRRLGVKLDVREIFIALKVACALMAADTQPVIHGLHGQLQIFRSFYFDHYQAALARDA